MKLKINLMAIAVFIIQGFFLYLYFSERLVGWNRFLADALWVLAGGSGVVAGVLAIISKEVKGAAVILPVLSSYIGLCLLGLLALALLITSM